MEHCSWSLPKLLLLVVALINLVPEFASAARYNLRNETDWLALLEFKQHIIDDPRGVFESWNDTQHHCHWQGITCDARHQRVTVLSIKGMTLSGSISPHIGNLSFLKSIHLGENRFHGEVPQEIGRLFRLRSLNMSYNILSGEIPVNLSHCLKLSVLHLASNNLEGKFPVELGYSLTSLEYLNLQPNNLTGEIPSSIGNLSSLVVFSLVANNLEGSFPKEMGLLKRLVFLSVGINRLSGTFPSFLYNISELTAIGLAGNLFHGNLPEDIGLQISNAERFSVSTNKFQGAIPISLISNATKLQTLDISSNKFEGNVPLNLGNLLNLQRLNLEMNLFGHNSSSDLDFLESLTNCTNLLKLSFAINQFGGELPPTMGNLSNGLVYLFMGDNFLSGIIPVELGRLKNLTILTLNDNLFSGTIPNDIGELERLQVLSFGSNMLFGHIPSNLFNITSLYDLHLAANNFGGTLPENLGNCQSLKTVNISQNNLSGVLPPAIFSKSFSPRVLDLSHNSFSGFLPPEVGKLSNINVFIVSNNAFRGEIPQTLGGCSSLEYLEMEANFFAGTIPKELVSLKGIKYLDLSQNYLIGQIPRDLERLSFLSYLNLSFNNLEGEIPVNGVFKNVSQIMLAENTKLCGGISQLRFPKCLVHQEKKSGKFSVIIVSSMLSVVVLALVITFISLFQRRQRGQKISIMPPRNDKILRVSYQELLHATTGFSQENIIGSGGYGTVYKGSLVYYKKNFVAIKVLNLQILGALESFKVECNALRNIRHRNLLSLLTYCSSIDFKGCEFKALVYDFMENGSLDMWLHPKVSGSQNLNLLQRLNISIDIASALDYLHNRCASAVVHRDLKPSNILLDKDLVAHVGDFGLAKLLKVADSFSGEDTSKCFAFKGSIGYVAPEYGVNGLTSSRGDVYSYGILLLEMLTGKRPTDAVFEDDLDLHNYAQTNVSSEVQVTRIIDPFLLSSKREGNTGPYEIELDEINENITNSLAGNNNTVQKYIIQTFEIALKCSARSPNDRMDMNEVLRQLQLTRDQFVAEQN